MAYSEFTLVEVKRAFQLDIDEMADLYSAVSPVPISPWLSETLDETLPLALAVNTEKVRSELVIAPILVELRRQSGHRISFFSGADFTVEPSKGLNDVCDYLISAAPEQLFVSSPVLLIVEAKNENIKGGLAQCIAAMVAAQLFNVREGNTIPLIHGAVTTGTTWRFLQLEERTVRIDRREYYIDQVEQIMGILVRITQPPISPLQLAA
jgi:hypothetical protein